MFQEKFDDDRPLEWMVLDDGIPTRTSEQQDDVLYTIYRQYKNKPNFIPKLKRDLHIEFLLKGLEKLSHHYECLDASRPWLAYWMIHSLNLLKHPLDLNFKLRAIETLRKCRNEDGGFGGGPGQTSHLASTYAAVHCLCSLNLVEAYDVIDRKKLMKWMTALKQEDGSFCLSIGGEIDIRGLYCAISILKLLNCDKLEFTEGEVTYSTKFLYNKSSEFIARCQTFDGGLGCYPGVEAHGGYVFCGLAAIRLLGDSHLLNMELLTKWAVKRQMEMEGGYQGRCNKLVDGCYCFWVGGAFPLLHLEEDIMNRELLQKYILKACQSPYGGCRDKPGKGVDHYHTCYVLSGLSISQYRYNIDSRVQLSQGIPNWLFYKIEPTEETINLKDEPDQVLIPTHPIFNIPIESVQKTYLHFSTKAE